MYWETVTLYILGQINPPTILKTIKDVCPGMKTARHKAQPEKIIVGKVSMLLFIPYNSSVSQEDSQSK